MRAAANARRIVLCRSRDRPARFFARRTTLSVRQFGFLSPIANSPSGLAGDFAR